MGVHITRHPLALNLLNRLRDKNTTPQDFRQAATTLSEILAFESTQDLPTVSEVVDTPLQPHEGVRLAVGLSVVPVLRAGLSMLDPYLRFFPDVNVGYVGLERSHETAIANRYYRKMPNMENRIAICVDPMLATGGSGSQAISMIKQENPLSVKFVCVVAAPQGIEQIQEDHPDVEIYTAAKDIGLNQDKYILPGLGDYGDRLYGTL